jgi:hypothetical protein
MIYSCSICHNTLAQERVDALKFLGKMPYDFQCFSCATIHGKKKQGIFTGLSGVSNLVITDNAGHIQHISQEREIDYQIDTQNSEIEFDIADKIS